VGAAEKMEQFQLDSAWKAKCEQAYNKAKISFGSDKQALEQIVEILRGKNIIK
jgi:hypothetical protein